MLWSPRLVAVDIDGTLVDRSNQVPASVEQAISRVVASGTPVVICTGRSWTEAQPIFDHLGLPDGYAVTSNGSVVLTNPPVRYRHIETFDPAPVLTRILEHAPDARIAVEDLEKGFLVNKHFPAGDLRGDVHLVDIDHIMSKPATRVIVRDPSASEFDFIDLAETVGMDGLSYSVGWSAWLDLMPAGVNKATGLEVVCRALRIRREDVLALGDGRNDIEMLRWVGRGVAIGDAVDEVKEAADHVTGSFFDDGTAEELDRWFGDVELARRSA